MGDHHCTIHTTQVQTGKNVFTYSETVGNGTFPF